jgi:hypothetical protein
MSVRRMPPFKARTLIPMGKKAVERPQQREKVEGMPMAQKARKVNLEGSLL